MRLLILLAFCISVSFAVSGVVKNRFACHKLLEWENVNGIVSFNATVSSDKNGFSVRATSGIMCEGGNIGDFVVAQEETSWDSVVLANWPKSNYVSNSSTVMGKFTTLCVFVCPFSLDTTITYEAYETNFTTTNEYDLYTNVMGFGACTTIGNRYSEGGVSVDLDINTAFPVKLIVETGLECGVRYFTPSNTRYNTVVKGGANNKILESLYFFNVTSLKTTVFIPNLISSLYCYIVCPSDVNKLYEKYRLDYKIELTPGQGDKVTFDNVQQLTAEIVNAQIKNTTEEVTQDIQTLQSSTSVLSSRIQKIEETNDSSISKEWIAIILGSIAILISSISVGFQIYQCTKSKPTPEINKSSSVV
jgi:hypothetical protein